MPEAQSSATTTTTPKAAKPLISVVVPVYNEEANVSRAYAELKRVAGELGGEYEFEYLFTDNCSTDSTFERLTEIAAGDPAVRVARFARNFGFQKSVLTGYRLTRGDAAIQIDADLQDPPALFPAFLARWREGHDVVVGVRSQRREGFLLQRARKAYYRLLAKLDGPHLTPDAGDFRLIDRSIIEKLRHIDDSQMYLRGLISSLARRQTGIPFDRAERIGDESKFRLGSLIQLAADGVLAHSSLPLKVAFYVGLVVALSATILAAFYFFLRLATTEAGPPGFTTTQLLILFGIGLNSLFLGVIGIYVGRIYDQVRKRPTTIVSDLINFDESIDQIERKLKW